MYPTWLCKYVFLHEWISLIDPDWGYLSKYWEDNLTIHLGRSPKLILQAFVLLQCFGTMQRLYSMISRKKKNTIFDLITAHTPISAQSRNSVFFRLQPVYFFLYFFTKAYVVGTHLNCIDKSMQFKWVPTTYAFVKKVRKKRIVIIK